MTIPMANLNHQPILKEPG